LENYGSKQVIIENGGHRLEHQTFDRRAHNRYFDRKILRNIASRTIVKNQTKLFCDWIAFTLVSRFFAGVSFRAARMR